MGRIVRNMCMAIVAVGVLVAPSQAAIMEVGDLNIIDQAGNPSNGLRFLDFTFSDGLNQSAALANAQASYANARLATPSEWDDLAEAAGVSYNANGFVFSHAFVDGTNETIVTTGDAGVALLKSVLGVTSGSNTLWWSDPDSDDDTDTTRDYIELTFGDGVIIYQTSLLPPHGAVGWLIVSEATSSGVPEPSSAILLGFAATVGCLAYRRRQATLANQPAPNTANA